MFAKYNDVNIDMSTNTILNSATPLSGGSKNSNVIDTLSFSENDF